MRVTTAAGLSNVGGHHGVVANPARVRDPKRQRSVEHAIGQPQATALKGRRFASINEQNTFLEHGQASTAVATRQARLRAAHRSGAAWAWKSTGATY